MLTFATCARKMSRGMMIQLKISGLMMNATVYAFFLLGPHTILPAVRR